MRRAAWRSAAGAVAKIERVPGARAKVVVCDGLLAQSGRRPRRRVREMLSPVVSNSRPPATRSVPPSHRRVPPAAAPADWRMRVEDRSPPRHERRAVAPTPSATSADPRRPRARRSCGARSEARVVGCYATTRSIHGHRLPISPARCLPRLGRARPCGVPSRWKCACVLSATSIASTYRFTSVVEGELVADAAPRAPTRSSHASRSAPPRRGHDISFSLTTPGTPTPWRTTGSREARGESPPRGRIGRAANVQIGDDEPATSKSSTSCATNAPSRRASGGCAPSAPV